VRQTLDYVLDHMTSAEAGFFSAEDADSEGEEGKFYVWTSSELDAVLSESDAALAATVWNLVPEGNFADESSGRRNGANIPHLTRPLHEIADHLGMESPQLERRLGAIRRTLFAAREGRIHPLKDDKVLTDWNGLMIAALARAGLVLHEARYLGAARRASDFVLEHMRRQDGRLLHRYRDGEAAVPGFLDDYAFLTWGLLELYDATLDPRILASALALQDATIELFWDEHQGGFFFTAADDERLLVRHKEVYDGAIPSGNSVAMHNLLRLSRLTGRSDLGERADRIVDAFAGQLVRQPSAHTHLLAAVTLAARPSLEVVIVGDPERADTRSLLGTARSRSSPEMALLLLPVGDAAPPVRDLVPYAAEFQCVDGKATAYVCRDLACQRPTTEPEELARLLTTPRPGLQAPPA
jgi:uncharacterized protein YyaL (SSP411 family)